MGEILLLAFLFLVAGVIAVPIASRLGLGSVLGYLIAGIALSPLLKQLHVDVVSIQHFAEFGVVMMLFLVGLELEPRMLWNMRNKLLGLGGLQVGVTTLLVMGIAMALGQQWNIALAIGMVLALSSTAIVLQTLNEKGLMKSDGGQSSFSVLLFQDIAVIPMLAIIPFLAVPELADLAHGPESAGDGHGSGPGFVASLPGWQRGLVTIGAIATVVVGGSYLTRPIFRFIAIARLRELFTAFALLMVVGIALLMTVVGLSPALGTFLAGVVLANSEYRHELEQYRPVQRALARPVFYDGRRRNQLRPAVCEHWHNHTADARSHGPEVTGAARTRADFQDQELGSLAVLAGIGPSGRIWFCAARLYSGERRYAAVRVGKIITRGSAFDVAYTGVVYSL